MPSPTPSPRVLRASEAARALGISLDTLRRWDRDGRIRVLRDRANRRMVPLSEVERIRPTEPLVTRKSIESALVISGGLTMRKPTCGASMERRFPLSTWYGKQMTLSLSRAAASEVMPPKSPRCTRMPGRVGS